MSVIKHDFVERRVSLLPQVPSDWMVGPGRFYQLDFKMCQIQYLQFNFEWGGSRSKDSIISAPHRVLILNVALNDLTELDHHGLSPLKQLRSLDASLNRITRYRGVEVLRHLYSLNLSHNHISHVEPGLQNCHNLYELNLAMNKLQDISIMPSLRSLTILHLNNNQLKNLEGIQALPQLKELYVQRNQLSSLVPLSSSLRLHLLHAADNNIQSFYTTLEVLKDLKRLQVLCLYGNPLEKENNYQSQLLHSTTIDTLDNISIRSHPQPRESYFGGNLHTIREATIQAFHDQIREQRQQMEDNMRFMQHRLKDLQDEHLNYEERMKRDLENCLRYLDNLTVDQLSHYNVPSLRERLRSPLPRPWEQQSWNPRDYDQKHLPKRNNDSLPYPRPEPSHKKDYRHVKDTDEVLRHVYNELSDAQKHDISK